MRTGLISLLLFLIGIPGFPLRSAQAASKVVIEGRFVNELSGEIRVLEYTDFISFREREICRGKISPDGSFKVNFALQDVGVVLLAYKNFRGRLIVEPDRSYNVSVYAIDQGVSAANTLSLGTLELSLTGMEESRLNGLVWQLDNAVDSFITKEYERIYLRHDRRLVRAFVDSLQKQYEESSHPFFRVYLEYTLGYLEYMGNLRTWESLRIKYFRYRKVEFANPAYMDLFSAIFDKYFIHYSKSWELEPLIQLVNERKSPKEFYDRCLSDTLFAGEPSLAELVMLKSVNDMFHIRDFQREDVYSLLGSLRSMLRNSYSKVVAINLMDQHASMVPGMPAPEIEGVDIARDHISLKAFRGKKVLLVFWDSNCITCRDEFSFISNYIRPAADSLSVVALNADSDFATFIQSSKSMPLGLEYLYIGLDYDLMEAYRVAGMPMYILIDSQGKIIENPTVSPGGDPNHFLLKVFGVR